MASVGGAVGGSDAGEGATQGRVSSEGGRRWSRRWGADKVPWVRRVVEAGRSRGGGGGVVVDRPTANLSHDAPNAHLLLQPHPDPFTQPTTLPSQHGILRPTERRPPHRPRLHPLGGVRPGHPRQPLRRGGPDARPGAPPSEIPFPPRAPSRPPSPRLTRPRPFLPCVFSTPGDSCTTRQRSGSGSRRPPASRSRAASCRPAKPARRAQPRRRRPSGRRSRPTSPPRRARKTAGPTPSRSSASRLAARASRPSCSGARSSAARGSGSVRLSLLPPREPPADRPRHHPQTTARSPARPCRPSTSASAPSGSR